MEISSDLLARVVALQLVAFRRSTDINLVAKILNLIFMVAILDFAGIWQYCVAGGE